MSEDKDGQDKPEETTQEETPAQDAPPAPRTEVNEMHPDAQRMIKEAREEAKSTRLKLKTLEDAGKLADEKRLADQDEWQTLAEQRALELAEMGDYKARWDDLTERVSEQNEKRVAKLSKDQRSLVPTYDDPLKLRDWLDTAEATFKRPAPPPTDAGVTGDKAPALPDLTADEIQMANLAKMPLADYAKQKAALANRYKSDASE